MSGPRTLPGDWYSGTVPENVGLGESSYLETSYSFQLYRSERAVGVELGRGASVYLGTMFDVGPRGQVRVGDYALLNGVRCICDDAIEIGDYALISWNVVLMDTYRMPPEPTERRRELERVPRRRPRRLAAGGHSQPIRIGRNVWIGFDVCVLPGVVIGEGAVVGARSVVAQDVAPFTVVAGNPARFIRRLEAEETGNSHAAHQPQ